MEIGDKLYGGITSSLKTGLRLGQVVVTGARLSTSAAQVAAQKVGRANKNEELGGPVTELYAWEAAIAQSAPVLEKRPPLALELGRWWIQIARHADSYSGKPPKSDRSLVEDYAWVLLQAGLPEKVIQPVVNSMYEETGEQPFDIDRRELGRITLASTTHQPENE